MTICHCALGFVTTASSALHSLFRDFNLNKRITVAAF